MARFSFVCLLCALVQLFPSPAPAAGLELLRFDDPHDASSRAALESAGVEILEAVPPRGYLVRVPEEARGRLPPRARVRPWSAADKLSPEAAALASGRLVPGGPVYLRAVTCRGGSSRALAGRVQPLVAPRAPLYATDDATGRGTLWVRATEHQAARVANALAAHPDVVWVERYALPVLCNDNASWLMQSGLASEGRTVFRRGLTGWGQVVGVADSGLDPDACQFRYGPDRSDVTLADDTHDPPVAAVTNPDNKVISYYVIGQGEAYDDSHGGFHGTHTVGDMAGDNYEHLATATAAAHDPHDGMAPGARIVFQDIGANDGTLRGLLGVTMYELLVQAYDTGVRVHNNSYGSATVFIGYDVDSASIDAAMWEYNDLLVVFAAGNSGADREGNLQPRSLGGTGSTAKNTLVVGASGPVELEMWGSRFYLENDLLFFSSQGPTADTRFKPEVVAPGLVFSATTDRNTVIDLGDEHDTCDHEDDNCNVDQDWPTMGTSFSSPLTAGAAVLVRQYFTDGFWLAGRSSPEAGFNPTNALVKACVINGAVPLSGVIVGMGENHPLSQPPSFEQGWGRVHLENALWFEGDQRMTLVLNDSPNPVPTNPMFDADLPPFPEALEPMTTGDRAGWILPHADPDALLKVTLAWSDPPAAAGAERTLINDLDLVVTAANDDRYLGNKNFDGTGHSQPVLLGDPDAKNNVEQVIIEAPEGSYRVAVEASSVEGNGEEGSDAQGYALLVTGEFLPPVPGAMDPDTAEPGDVLTDVRLTGDYFVAGMTVDLGEGITVEGVEVENDSTALIGTLTVDAVAESGERDVTATVLRTVQGTGEALFRVGLEEQDASITDGGQDPGASGGGCGCATRSRRPALVVLLLALGMFILRRKVFVLH